MLRLAGVVLAVGLADSLNPSTVGPALYLATGQRPVARVSLFALGVFAVNLTAGLVLAAGPGRLGGRCGTCRRVGWFTSKGRARA